MTYEKEFLKIDDNTRLLPKTRSSCIYISDSMDITLDSFMNHHTHNMSDILDLFVDEDGKILLQQLTILINGAVAVEFNGTEAKSLNISLESLGAAASNHNHDSVYAKVNHSHSEYAPLVHTHTVSDIIDFPTDIGGGGSDIKSLRILFNGFEQIVFDGKEDKSLDITASGIGAAEANHTHTFSAITNFEIPKLLFTLKGYDAATGSPVTTTIEYDGTEEVSASITPESIGASVSTHKHDYDYYTKTAVDAMIAELTARVEALEQA